MAEPTSPSPFAALSVRIQLASPEQIRQWSCGEVTSPSTISERHHRPEREGLFCQRIFGPVRDWCCACVHGNDEPRYWGPEHEGRVCPGCQVRIASRAVRRLRLGHIELAYPVIHTWFLRAKPSPLAILLGMKRADLDRILRFEAHAVINPAGTSLRPGQLLDADGYREARLRYGTGFQVEMGAWAIKRLLAQLNLDALAQQLREQLARDNPSDLLRRLRLVEELRASGNRPEWMVLECLPVIPPDLRPIVVLDPQVGRATSTHVSSDFNFHYQKILALSNKIRDWTRIKAIEAILRHERVRLQEAVDALLDNRHAVTPLPGKKNRLLRSLTDSIAGKQGLLRKNLLGKRVDFSGRAVIVVDPRLQMHQCGLPRCIAEELFQPFLIGRLRRLFEERLGLETRPALLLATMVSKHRDAAARRLLRETLLGGKSGGTPHSAGDSAPLREALTLLDHREELIHDLLKELLQDHLVLLNRAPSLHRMNVQAFTPVLVEGKALRVSPLVCEGFAADFDGDTMAIHLPLSDQARIEAALLMQPALNLLSPANGQPLTPSNEIVLGCYYLTLGPPRPMQGGAREPLFACFEEVRQAYTHGKVGIHTRIRVRLTPGKIMVREGRGKKERVRVPAWDEEEQRPAQLDWLIISAAGGSWFEVGEVVTAADFARECRWLEGNGEPLPVGRSVEANETAGDWPTAGGVVRTTVGRVLFNELLPRAMPFYNVALSRKALAGVMRDSFAVQGRARAARLLDQIKELGLEHVTRSGLSFLLEDLRTPRNKAKVLEATRRQIEAVQEAHQRGEVSEAERYRQVVALWTHAQKEITEQLRVDLKNDVKEGQPYLNPIYLMAHSGARSRWEQIRQLAALRGLMARPSGERRTLEHCIQSSLREGLSMVEYFLSAHGARKAGADKAALPESGYLTRKLVDVAHHVIVTEEDCGTLAGLSLPLRNKNEGTAYLLGEELRGRCLAEDVLDDRGLPLLRRNDLVNEHDLPLFERRASRRVVIRSPLACRARRGICQRCYGRDLSTGRLVERGTAVGVLAAQSIGEPGTQLAMKTKHTGGVVGAGDMVSGLERVLELFEARVPRNAALLAGCRGIVEIRRNDEGTCIVGIHPQPSQKVGSAVVVWQGIPHGEALRVQEGDLVEVGTPLTEGPLSLHGLLSLAGREAVDDYLLRELQTVYRDNGVQIDNKHFEIIIAQMLRRVCIRVGGDTGWLPGMLVDRLEVERANQSLQEGVQNRSPHNAPPLAQGEAVVLGIKQAALQAESFLSAASFEATARVLAEAALAGRVDPLLGLKENVILGQLIPAGTGLHGRGEPLEFAPRRE